MFVQCFVCYYEVKTEPNPYIQVEEENRGNESDSCLCLTDQVTVQLAAEVESIVKTEKNPTNQSIPTIHLSNQTKHATLYSSSSNLKTRASSSTATCRYPLCLLNLSHTLIFATRDQAIVPTPMRNHGTDARVSATPPSWKSPPIGASRLDPSGSLIAL